MKILIKNGLVIDMRQKQEDMEIKDILIENEKIKNIQKDIQETADKIIDARGKVVMPGLINGHNHAAMSIFRGYSDDLELKDWLQNAIWPIEDKLTKEDIYFASKLSCIEMIKSGTTTFNDMYFFTEETARAVEETGIRAYLGRTIIMDGTEAEKRLEEAEKIYKEWNEKAEGRIYINLPPHAPYTCNPETLAKCVDMAKKYNMPIHVHLSETEKENKDIQKEYHKTPTEYLEDCGVFEVPCILAHGVHLNAKDIEIIKKARARNCT